ncbi:unnamed protein product, partial [Allacma fusca]
AVRGSGGAGRGGRVGRFNQLLDYVNRWDRYCPWRGHFIWDSALERPRKIFIFGFFYWLFPGL